jgi:hypothetical protein
MYANAADVAIASCAASWPTKNRLVNTELTWARQYMLLNACNSQAECEDALKNYNWYMLIGEYPQCTWSGLRDADETANAYT